MAASNTPFLSTDLLKQSRSRQADPAPVVHPALERIFLRYGEKAMAVLEAQGEAMTDRQLFEVIGGGGSFPEFRQALAEMVRRGLVVQAGIDPTFGDPLYRAMTAA